MDWFGNIFSGQGPRQRHIVRTNVLHEDDGTYIYNGGPIDPQHRLKIRHVLVSNFVREIKNDSFCKCHGLISVKILPEIQTITKKLLQASDDDTHTDDNHNDNEKNSQDDGIDNDDDDDGNKSEKKTTSTLSETETLTISILNLERIGDFAFCGCKHLTSIEFVVSSSSKASVSSSVPIYDYSNFRCIGKFAFWHCSSLDHFQFPKSSSSNLTSLKLLSSPSSSSSSSLASINNNNNNNNNKNVFVDIGTSAFYFCTSLSSIDIPDGVTHIAKRTFASCYALRQVTLSKSIVDIGECAFSDCFGLTTIVFPTEEGDDEDNDGTSVSKVETKNNPYDDSDESEPLSSCCHPTTSTSKEMEKKTSRKKARTIIIGDFAFRSCSSLRKLILPNSISQIGECAFGGCTSLKHIQLPNDERFRSIHRRAFLNCSSLEYIHIPESIGTIEEWTFHGCIVLQNIHLPTSIQYIAKRAFENCSTLKSMTVPSNVKSIGDRAFLHCSSLSTFEFVSTEQESKTNTTAIPATTKVPPSQHSQLEEIGNYSFYGCSSLQNIYIPNQTKDIGNYAFQDCDQLQRIRIPISLQNLGNGTFIGCPSLKTMMVSSGDMILNETRSMQLYCDLLRGGLTFLQKRKNHQHHHSSIAKNEQEGNDTNTHKDDQKKKKCKPVAYPAALWSLIFYRALKTMEISHDEFKSKKQTRNHHPQPRQQQHIQVERGEADSNNDERMNSAERIRRIDVVYNLLVQGAASEILQNMQQQNQQPTKKMTEKWQSSTSLLYSVFRPVTNVQEGLTRLMFTPTNSTMGMILFATTTVAIVVWASSVYLLPKNDSTTCPVVIAPSSTGGGGSGGGKQ